MAPKGKDGVFSSAVWDEQAKEYVVKVVNTTADPQPVRLRLEGCKKLGAVHTITLDCSTFEGENTLDNPNLIEPRHNFLASEDNEVTDVVGRKQFVIYRIGKASK